MFLDLNVYLELMSVISYSLALPIVQIFVQTDVRIFYKPVTKYKLENGEKNNVNDRKSQMYLLFPFLFVSVSDAKTIINYVEIDSSWRKVDI